MSPDESAPPRADGATAVDGPATRAARQRERVWICEIAPRDGLQNEAVILPTGQKIALIDAIASTGVAKIEATSFVSPKAIPPLADAEAVMRGIRRVPGVTYAALIPNERGAQRALECGVDEFNLVMSASETHNLCNLRMTRDQSLQALRGVIALARAARVPVNASISCAFGCPMEGDVDPAEVLRIARALLDEGAQGVTLCDTTGMAYPTQVGALVEAFGRECASAELTLHFHDTRGMALANALASLQAGARNFDASIGGIGGCPYAPGASGNACTEDLVHMLELVGYDTGIDLAAMIEVSRGLPALLGHEVPGQIAKAGRRLDLHRPPASFEEIKARAQARSVA